MINWEKDFDRLNNNPSIILWLIREGKVRSIEDLYSYFSVQQMTGSILYFFKNRIPDIIKQFKNTGLIEEKHGILKVTKLVAAIQKALGLSIKELSQKPLDSISVSPIFGLPQVKEGLDIFVLMPFTSELKPVYDDHIKMVATELCYSIAGYSGSLFPMSPVIGPNRSG